MTDRPCLDPGELFSLRGKTVVLTGATGFLGQTMAEAILAAGGRLVAIGRSGRLDELGAGWVRRFGADRAAWHRAGLDRADELDAVVEALAGESGIDGLVNNAHQLDHRAGFNSPTGTLETMDAEQWAAHLDGGVWWAARLIQGLGDQLKASRGSVVNISSMYGVVAPSPLLYAGTDKANPPGYAAAKAAILALTRYVASYWGGYGVRANAILPGPFSNISGDSENSVAADDPFLERLHQRTALGRTGRPHELAGALMFLLSDASSYVTGHSLVVDGGWTIT